jgi:two-component system, OmpR family, sensor histidine kinase VicK
MRPDSTLPGFLARSDSSTLPLDFRQMDACALLEGLTGTAEMLAREHETRLETDLAGNGMITVDPSRIEQALLVLIDNAAKYNAADQPIHVSSWTQRDELVIAVTDHGPGISEADLPFIFERFYRVDKTRSRRLGGVGLGLSIARSIVELHGGRIVPHS